MHTGYHVHSRYVRHETPPGHPESPARIDALIGLVGPLETEGVVLIETDRRAEREELLRAHTARHIDTIAATAGLRATSLDPDTTTSPESHHIACHAAGALLHTVDAVYAGGMDNAFVAARPPGHHAERERAMGFCLFNNVAVAAHHLIAVHGLQRVLIVDWDVHHGNGTQHIFYNDPRVLFVSLHQHPLYPGTGMAGETGDGDGVGFTINLPLPSGLGDDDYIAVMDAVVVPAAQRFAPEFVLVSAGFDAHRRDPLASMRLTEWGFDEMTRRLLALAHDSAGDRMVAILEGGYDLRGLVDSTATVIRRLHEPEVPTPIEHKPTAKASDVCRQVCEIHGERWGLDSI